MVYGNPRDHIGHVTIGLFSSATLNEIDEIKKNLNQKKEMTNLLIDSLEEFLKPGTIKNPEELIFQRYQETEVLRKTLYGSIYCHPKKEIIDEDIKGLQSIFREIINTKVPEEKNKNYDKAHRFLYELGKNATELAEIPLHQGIYKTFNFPKRRLLEEINQI
jgi:hypothetical protein